MRLGMGLGLGNLLSGQPLTGFPNDFSFNFDGSNDYLAGSDLGLPSSSNARSVSFWINADSVTTYGMMFSYGTSSSNSAFAISWDNTNAKIIVGKFGGNANSASSSTISTGSWNHIVVTFDGSSTIKYYLNGSADGTATLSGINTVVNEFRIGEHLNGWSGANFFDGKIDEVAVWNAELSASDVAKLGSKPVDLTKYSAANLKLWLRCGDKAEPESNTAIARQDFYTDFDGTNDFVNIGDDTSLDITNSITLSAWINAGSINQHALLVGRDDGVNRNYYLDLFTDEKIFWNCKGLSDTQVGSSTTISANEWYHIAGTYDGSNLKIYINGILEDSDASTGSIDNDDVSFTIGAREAGMDRHFDGAISNVSLYKTALDAQTISQMAKSRFTPMRNNRFSVVDFDGSNDFITISNNSALSFGTNAHTISAWAKLDVLANFKTIISKRQAGGTATDYNLSVGANGVVYTYNGSTTAQTATGVISAGSWFHYALVYSGSAYQLYINGSAVAWASGTTTSGASNSHDIGIGWDRSGNYWDGAISSVSLYNVEKSAEEICAIYQQGITYDESSLSGLVGLWRMGDDTSRAFATIADSSSNSNDGTITNGASDDIVQQMVAGYDMGAYDNSTEELSAERITNEDFSAWTADNPDGWSVSTDLPGSVESDDVKVTEDANGARIFTTGTNINLKQNSAMIVGTMYKVTIVVHSATSGDIKTTGLTSNITNINASGTYTVTTTASNKEFNIKRNTACDIVVSSASVKEVLQSEVSDTHPAIIDVTEPVLGVNLVDDNTASQYTPFENNTVANITNGIKITYVDDPNGAFAYLNTSDIVSSNLTVGNLYKATFNAYYEGGSSGVNVSIYPGAGSDVSGDVLTTSNAEYSIYFIPTSNHAFIRLQNFASSNIVYLTNLEIQEIQGNVGTMTNQDSADLVYSSVLPDQSFLTGVNSAYNFIDLDGSDAFINCGGDIDVVVAFAISAWVNSDVIATSLRSIASQGNSFFGFGDASAGKLLFQGQGSSANNLQSQTALTADTWFHIVLSVSGTNAGDGAIYVNGSRDDDGESTVFLTAGDFVIGKMPTASSRYWNGKITQVAIYNKALTSTEVSGIYDLGRHGNLLDSYSDNLKGYWVMGGLDSKTGLADTDSTIYDRSGNSNHGTTSGTATGDLKSPPNAEPEGYAKGDTNRSTTTP